MNLMNPIINDFFTLNATAVCYFDFKITNFNNYMFTMITLDSVQNIPYEMLTKLTKMH